MSRLTASQVVDQGEYLSSDFDPSSLTVSQLLGVLGYHNIAYPTPYTKPKLVELFNNEIKSRASILVKERLKRKNSQASDEGIINGVTGQPLGETKKASTRRSSRRLSRAPTEQETSPVRSDLPKRRRSSAQPSLGGPSRRKAVASQAVASQAVLVEESEPEHDDLPVRKVGRSQKSMADAGSQARRVSQFAEDSGWEDNNIFQSGAESSSPIRPSPVRHKPIRKSLAPRKSRQSMSAPPQISLLEHKKSVELKDEADELNLIDGDPGVDEHDASIIQAFEEVQAEVEAAEGVEEDDTGSDNESTEDEDYSTAVSHRIAEGGRLATRRHDSSPDSQPMPLLLRLSLALLLMTTLAATLSYKLESASIGYCDAGKNTSAVLEAILKEREAADACSSENRTLLHLPPDPNTESFVVNDEGALCPPPSLVPYPHPTSCTPCPKHATCTQDTVTCDNGYLLRSHPLLSFLPPFPSRASTLRLSTSLSPSEMVWRVVSGLMDGLPSFGPVAFPPRCLEDPKRKRNIGVLGKAVETMLGQERGRRLCAGVPPEIDDKDGGEARRWGIELGQLREATKKKIAPHLLPTFDDTFHEAIQQLILWGGVTLGEDSERKRYLAHQTPDLTWNCAITVKCREIWAEWRATVIGAIAVIVAGYIGRFRRTRRRIENKRIAELVQIALDTLRNQELAHHTDPITAPYPYLSSLQLRDLILQDEHSIPIRRRLWSQVERVVEGNANVRANLEEVRGGDEMRVWRWVGGSGLRKRVGDGSRKEL